MTTAHRTRVRITAAAALFSAAAGVCLLATLGPPPARGAQKSDPLPKSSDPLFPTNVDDVATGYAACGACHAQSRPINTKTNVFAKKFKSHEFVLLSEGGTWLTEDPHSAAHRVLTQDLGQQMSRILKYDVTKAPQCLTCHAIDKYPGLPITKDTDVTRRFNIAQDAKGKVTSEGVTCNACHGLRKAWQGEHYADEGGTIPWRTMTPEYKTVHGMRNLRDPVVKAELCASCHVGSPELNRVVTHDMYAAGHPPLPPFELGTFMDCEPQHWGYPINPELKFFTDEGFKAFTKKDTVPENWRWNLYRFHPEKEEVYIARQMTAGAVASLRAEMRLIAADAATVAKGEGGGTVDFARFDCYACHHDLKIPSARQARGYAGAPGRPPLKAWVAAFPTVVVEHAVSLQPLAGQTKDFTAKWDAVQKAALAQPFGKPKELAQSAAEMAGWCEAFLKKDQTVTSPLYTSKEADKLLTMMGEAATSKRWVGDPEAAMHLTWAYLTLRRHRANPTASPEELRKIAMADGQLEVLRKVVPTRVRMPRKDADGSFTYSTDSGDPMTVGQTLRQRLDLFNKFNPDDFTASFRAVSGGMRKKP